MPRSVSSLVIVAALLSAHAGVASEIEEIVVRADLRQRNVADLPPAVTVIGAEQIAATGLAHFEEISHTVANLNFAGGSNRPRYFQIRGTGERSQYEGAPNPSVGFIIDDMDFSAIGGVALTWDVEQVEVLRGPQGTRYGANALAGLIHVTSAPPAATRDLKWQLLAGGDDALGIGLAATTPLAEASAIRVSAWHYKADGFRDNAFLGVGDSNRRDESELRLRYRFEHDDLRVDATALYVDVDNGYDAFAIDNGFTVYSDRPGRDAQRSLGGSLRIAAPSRVGDWTSITAAVRSDIDFDFDADWGNAQFWSPFTYDFVSGRRRIRETVSQELRLTSAASGPFDWVVGAYVSTLREDLIAVDSGVYVDPAFGEFTAANRLASDYAADNLALFGEVEFGLNESTALAVGLRLERRQADYVDTAGIDVSPGETMFGGHVTLTRESGDWRTFLSYSRGYKAGGFNLGPVPAGRREFDAEFMDNLELGVRTTLLDGALRAAASVFYAERDEQQVATSAQLVANDPASFVFFTDNAAEGSQFGAELEARWRLSDRLEASLAIGLLDTDVDAPGNSALDGRDQAHAPRYTFAAGLRWSPLEHWFGRVDVTGKDDFYFSNSHAERASAYALLNARIGFRRGAWEVSLWGRNLTDRHYAVRGFFFGNEPPDFPNRRYVRLGDPRQIGLTLNWRLE